MWGYGLQRDVSVTDACAVTIAIAKPLALAVTSAGRRVAHGEPAINPGTAAVAGNGHARL
jgi:hypothetical protein